MNELGKSVDIGPMQLKKFVVNFHKQLLGPQSLFLDPFAIKSFYFVEFSNLM